MIQYNKLVRDRIPEIITEHGELPITTILGDLAYRQALLDKLVEEAIELRDSDGALEERADVEEVLLALDAVLGLSRKIVEDARVEKANERGGFDAKIFLERVEERQ